MPFIPRSNEDALRDAFWFVVAPLMSVPTLVYSGAGYVTDDYPLGRPDWGANFRNALIWGGAAGLAYGWNLAFSPHNAVWMTGSSAYKVAGHLAMGSAAVIVAGSVLVGTPVAMVANRRDPNQGRQLQSAGSGQPSIGSRSLGF